MTISFEYSEMGGHRQEVRGLKWSSDYQSGLWQQTFLCGIIVLTSLSRTGIPLKKFVIFAARVQVLCVPSPFETAYFSSIPNI